MSSITLTSDDVIEAFCKMLEPGIAKGVLPKEDCNRWGVDVLYNKKDPHLIMFHFVTKDMLEVNLEMDLYELKQRGKEYLDHLYGLLCDQTQMAREERQKENTIYLDQSSVKIKEKPLSKAINRSLH